MKGLRAMIYKSESIGDCSNNGISSKLKEVTIVGPDIPEIFDATESAPAVKLVFRKSLNYTHAEPVEGKSENACGWMAGGCFIYTCDSRFPSTYPIALHDRQEVA